MFKAFYNFISRIKQKLNHLWCKCFQSPACNLMYLNCWSSNLLASSPAAFLIRNSDNAILLTGQHLYASSSFLRMWFFFFFFLNHLCRGSSRLPLAHFSPAPLIHNAYIGYNLQVLMKISLSLKQNRTGINQDGLDFISKWVMLSAASLATEQQFCACPYPRAAAVAHDAPAPSWGKCEVLHTSH